MTLHFRLCGRKYSASPSSFHLNLHVIDMLKVEFVGPSADRRNARDRSSIEIHCTSVQQRAFYAHRQRFLRRTDGQSRRHKFGGPLHVF